MSIFTLSDRYGRPFKVGLPPLSGNLDGSWRRRQFTPGQAGLFLQRFDSLQLESLRKHFSYRSYRTAITPLNSLSGLFEMGTLCFYEKSNENETTQDKQQTVAEMSMTIDGEFKKLLAINGFAAGTAKTGGSSAAGIVDTGANLKSWFADSQSVLSPLWHIKRQIEHALDDYNRHAAENSPRGDLAVMANYLQRANIKDHRIIVKAFGLNPEKISVDQFSVAWHSAWILVGDPKVSQMIRKFSLGYMGVQTHTNLSQGKYGAVFEVILAILLTTNATAKHGKTAIANIGTPYNAVFVAVAEQLVKISRQVAVRPGPFKSGPKKSKPQKPAAQAKAAEPAPEPAAPKPKAQNTPADDTQAQTLVEAAKNGAPFCEACEKLKQERLKNAA